MEISTTWLVARSAINHSFFALLRENTLWGPEELQNAKNNPNNLICVSWSLIYTLKKTKTNIAPSQWKEYWTADVSIYVKTEMNRFHKTS